MRKINFLFGFLVTIFALGAIGLGFSPSTAHACTDVGPDAGDAGTCSDAGSSDVGPQDAAPDATDAGPVDDGGPEQDTGIADGGNTDSGNASDTGSGTPDTSTSTDTGPASEAVISGGPCAVNLRGAPTPAFWVLCLGTFIFAARRFRM